MKRISRSTVSTFLHFSCFFTGCFLCYFLQSQFSLNSVLSAALIGFTGSFIPENRHIENIHIHALLYMGAFVAMGQRVVELDFIQMILISTLGTGLYLLTRPYLNGFGGRLGTLAFITSLLGFLVRYVL